MSIRRLHLPDVFRGLMSPVFFDPATEIPAVFAPRGRWKSGPMHTFSDDYRQEVFFRKPYEGLIAALAAGVVTAPDFTIFTDDPEERAAYQFFRSLVVAQFWQQNGVQVLPVVSFHSACSCRVRHGSAWAVRGPRAGGEAEFLFHMSAFVRVFKPALLCVFGRSVVDDAGRICGVGAVERKLFSARGITTAQNEGRG